MSCGLTTNFAVYLPGIDPNGRHSKSWILEFQTDITSCVEVLQKGGLILYPTDTIWGIGCDATNPFAVEKVYALKKRPEKKSLIVLLSEETDLLKYTSQIDPDIFNFLHNLKAPTTVIYQSAIGLAENLISEDGTVAIRIITESFCSRLIKSFQKPIVSSSANISGEPSPRFFDEINDKIKQGVDYMVEYRQDDTRSREPSSIVKWNIDGTVKVIRP